MAKGKKMTAQQRLETSEALGELERQLDEAMAKRRIAYCKKRIAKATYDLRLAERESVKVSHGSTLDDVEHAQEAVDKAQKYLLKEAAVAREENNAVDAINEKISQLMNADLPLFDKDAGDGEDGEEADAPARKRRRGKDDSIKD